MSTVRTQGQHVKPVQARWLEQFDRNGRGVAVIADAVYVVEQLIGFDADPEIMQLSAYRLTMGVTAVQHKAGVAPRVYEVETAGDRFVCDCGKGGCDHAKGLKALLAAIVPSRQESCETCGAALWHFEGKAYCPNCLRFSVVA